MTASRRMAAGAIEAVMCIGGFLVFAAIMALLFGLFHALGGGIVHGLFLNPKSLVGSLIGVVIPCIASVSIAATLVLKRLLGPLFDRLERWKAKRQ
jgi:hypothetical protein